MALRKVRNNIDRLFDKNLTDLIRGIRNNKGNEARYIAACIEEIKLELRQDSIFIKANAIEKLAYLQMLGYEISWASFNIVEVMASTKYAEKRIGYLAATQAFNDETDVLMLTTNLIRKDLQSSNLYDVGVALSGLACFATSDLARDLVNDVVNLLSSSRMYVRKKAVLLLYKIFLKYPESLRPTFSRLRDKLEDPDPGVQSAAVNVICELARKNPRNYLSLHEVFFRLMNTSSNNWMLIKIIKLFGSLVPLESKIGKKLLEPLTNLINSTSAMSLLYECINTVIAVLISISTDGPGDYLPSIQLCVQKLGVLIEDSDQNLKYLGLLAMGKILQTHPKAVQAHKDIVLRCLNDKDESIRLRALDLLYGMVSKKNIMEIVKKLMEHVDAAEGSFYRDELLSRIISICSHNNYQYITNFEWYISVLVELTKVEGSKHGVLISEQIQDVTVRVQSIRHFSVSQMALLVENAHLLLAGNFMQRSNICAVLLAAAWICGEYAEHVNNVSAVLDAMLRTKISIVPGELLSVYIQNIAKLYSLMLNKHETEDDWDSVESLDNLMLSKFPEFQFSDHLEAQERACNLVELLKFIEGEHSKRVKIGAELACLFEGELNPVASKAQRRVPVPEGLDLDAWINKPDSDKESTDSSEDCVSESLFLTVNNSVYSQPVSNLKSDNTKHEKLKSKNKQNEAEIQKEIEESRRRRKFEQENNPYYMKTSQTANKRIQPSSSGSSVNKLTANGRPVSFSAEKKSTDDTPSTKLQSPLEIPGVYGLNRYIKQQELTLSWQTAKNDQQDSAKQKQVKKSKKDGGKGKRRLNKKNLSVLSSSDEGCAADVGTVVHHVNRDDGEMPEDALSSNDDADKYVNDEFRALNIDLDEPLREDEKLFVPRPYSNANLAAELNHALSNSTTYQALPHILSNSTNKKKAKKNLTNKLSDGEDEVKTPKKKLKKKSQPVKNIVDSKNSVDGVNKKLKKDELSIKKKAKKQLDKSVSNDSESYSCIKSTKKRLCKDEQQIISFGDEDTPCFSGNTNVSSKETKTVLKKNENSLADSSFCNYKFLTENEHIKLEYFVKTVNSSMKSAEVSIAFTNKSASVGYHGFKLFVLENTSVQLDDGVILPIDANDAKSEIRLPFELPVNTCAEYSLHLKFNSMDVSQRVRGSVTYFDDDNIEVVIDFTLVLKALNFLQFATIGSTSYELILASAELNASSQQQCESSNLLNLITESICKNSNFSVVAVVDEAVSLYAHSSENQHVCVLIKKTNRMLKTSKGNASPIMRGNNGDSESPGVPPELGTVTVSVKCTTSVAHASALANELCEQITRGN